MVMVLFNLSEAIEALSLDRARQAIGKLLALTPERATVLDASGNWAEVDIQQVAVGARVRVRPGEKVGLDGVVASGMSTVNQALITGESMPVEKRSGDPVGMFFNTSFPFLYKLILPFPAFGGPRALSISFNANFNANWY